MAEVIPVPLRDWLAAEREALNSRFRRMQRRMPQLNPADGLALLRELLPPLGGTSEPGTPALLSAVYDLVLLHAGRGTLLPDGGLPGIHVLLRETLPKIRRLLLERPDVLPAALSNAVENLGPRGPEFAHAIAEVAESLDRSGELLDAGAVLAWRLGESRLRKDALEAASRLPARATLCALRLRHWPDVAAPLVVTGLAADAWRRPETLFTEQTLHTLPQASPERVENLRNKVSTPISKPPGEWALAGRAGDFIGFGGHFPEPPRLLDPGNQGNRYRYWVRSADQNFQIDADCFGWVCRPDPTAEFPLREINVRSGKLGSLFKTKTSSPRLYSDGTFERQSDSATIPIAAQATSYAAYDDALAVTHADSFRVRILAPARRSL